MYTYLYIYICIHIYIRMYTYLYTHTLIHTNSITMQHIRFSNEIQTHCCVEFNWRT